MQTDDSFSTTVQDSISTHSFRKITFIVLTAILAFAGTLALYWESLKLPLFFDDMVHLRWLDWHSLLSIWLTAEGLGYYRPLTMSMWKLSYLLLGYNDPTSYHFLNLFLHGLNSALTGYIAWRAYRGSGRVFYALLATLIFLSYPFSYQAIPSSSSLSKPLIATLTLASVLLYWEARRRRSGNQACSWSRWLIGDSLLIAFLAPFAYETGVMLPLAILAVELLGYVRKEFERFSRLPVLYMLLIWGVAFPLIILMGPKTEGSLNFSSWRSLWQNGTYFVEGLLFPITPIGTPLEQMLQIDWYILLSVINIVGLVALLAFYRWSKHIPLFLYALSWFVVGVLPQWLVLDFSYVITSPRILYLGAVGSALLWAGVPILLWVKRPQQWWPKIVAVASMLGMLSFNTFYVRHKMELADALSMPLWQAAQAAQVEKHPASLLYLNVPAWVAPKEPIYRIGTEGLTFIPEYTRVQDFVYVNTGLEQKIKSFIFNPIKQDWKAYIGYVGYEIGGDELVKQIRDADGVFLTTYSPDELRFVEAGALQEEDHEPSDKTPFARFGDQILLQEQQTELSDGELVLKLWWYCQQEPHNDVTVFAHVYDEAGQLITQRDGYPLSGLFSPQKWDTGDLVRDIRYIPLPDDMSDKRYSVAIGWYDTSTGQRLPAFDQQNQPATNNAIILYQK